MAEDTAGGDTAPDAQRNPCGRFGFSRNSARIRGDSTPCHSKSSVHTRNASGSPSCEEIRELKASTRTIELIFFLRVTLLELTDAAATLQTGRRVSDLVRQAYDRTTVRQARSAIEYRQQLVAIRALVQDSERTAQERLDDIGKLLECLVDSPPASHAASVRETLSEDHHRIHNLLGPLHELGFVGRDAEPSLRQFELVGTLHDSGATELRATAMCRSAPPGAISSRVTIGRARCGHWKPLRNHGSAQGGFGAARSGSTTACPSGSATSC